jgi:hypothetical protein
MSPAAGSSTRPYLRKVSARLTVTYAGFEGESDLLEGLYKRGIEGVEIAPDLRSSDGMLMYWTHRACAPWQSESWLDKMRRSLRPIQYLRMIENRWVTNDSSFVDPARWQACIDTTARQLQTGRSSPVWVGVDASVKRDSTAVVAVTFDSTAKKVRLVWHRVFQPSAAEPLEFEQTIERSLIELKRRFSLKEVRPAGRRWWSLDLRAAGPVAKLSKCGLWCALVAAQSLGGLLIFPENLTRHGEARRLKLINTNALRGNGYCAP